MLAGARARALVVLLCVCAAVCVQSATPPPAGNTIPINGTASWALGVNYPWNDYGGDFGSNAWGYNGVATSTSNSKVKTDFTSIHTNHGRVVRWWLFSDGRAGITFNSGTPTGIDSHVIDDIQAAVNIAKATKTFIVLSLFDFSWLQNAQTLNGVTMGGHTDTLTDSAKLTALINNVILPVVTKFKSESAILAWELMNEPEWVISNLPQPAVNSNINPVTQAQYFNFASKVTAAIRSVASQYVTVGSACLKWYRVWTPAYATQNSLPILNLDFYQTHYYSWMDPYCSTNDPQLGTVCYNPLKQSVPALKLDRPMVVGEFAASTNASGLLQTLYNQGYAGAWPWSYTTDYTVDWKTYLSWATTYNNIIHWTN